MELAPGSDSLRRMNEQRPPDTEQITDLDWERTPTSVKQLVMDMAQGLAKIEQQLVELQAENQLLKEQINRTSNNSSQASSSDSPKAPKRKPKEKSPKRSLRHLPAGSRRATSKSEWSTRA